MNSLEGCKEEIIAKYLVKGLLVGPYLPPGLIELAGARIYSGDLQSWKTPLTPISAEGGDKESIITFTPKIATMHTPAILEYECDAPSSREADIIGRQKFESICDVLSVGCIQNKYHFSITEVTRLSPGADPESPMSEPLHVLSYEFQPLNVDLENYAKSICALKDDNTKKVVAAFGKALRDGSSIELFKILEMITHLLSSDLKAMVDDETVAEEKKVIASLHKVLMSDKSLVEKKNAIKSSSEDLRRLNLEQNGKRIAAAAEYLEFKGDMAKIVDRAVRYRNKVLAHHDSTVKSKTTTGPMDIQESARFFVIRYIYKKFGLRLPIMSAPPVPYKDYWYSVTYANSLARKKV